MAMRPQLPQEKLVTKENASIFLSVLLHVFFLLVLSYQINFVYQYPHSNLNSISVDLIQDLRSTSEVTPLKKQDSAEKKLIEKAVELAVDSSTESITETPNAVSPLTSGWRTLQKSKQIEASPQNNLQARIGIEQSQRYSKIQANLIIARDRLSNEQTLVRCAIKLDDQLLKGNITCNEPIFADMIKNFLLPIGINWLSQPQEAMKTCIPIAIRATGTGLCS